MNELAADAGWQSQVQMYAASAPSAASHCGPGTSECYPGDVPAKVQSWKFPRVFDLKSFDERALTAHRGQKFGCCST